MVVVVEEEEEEEEACLQLWGSHATCRACSHKNGQLSRDLPSVFRSGPSVHFIL